MKTTSQPTPSEQREPEDRRTDWLFAVLLLPIAVVPVSVWAWFVMMRSPNIDALSPDALDAARVAFMATTTVANLAGLAILLVRPLSRWFGLSNLARQPDERDRAIFTWSTLTAYIVMLTILLFSTVVLQSTVAAIAMAAGVCSFCLSMVVFSRHM